MSQSDADFFVRRMHKARLRPTHQRLALAEILFSSGNRHITAEQLHNEARLGSVGVSLATIYNTLNQFTQAGLLREVVIAPGCSYFDTNLDDHHHFFFEDSGLLVDIPDGEVGLSDLPPPPDGSVITRIDVIIRLTSQTAEHDSI